MSSLPRLALWDLATQSATVPHKPAPLDGSAVGAQIDQLCAHRGNAVTTYSAAPNERAAASASRDGN